MSSQGHFGRNYYYWRRLTADQQKQVLKIRKAQNRPWHSPPHYDGEGRFIISATCYEHEEVIGHSLERIADYEAELLSTVDAVPDTEVHAWSVMPNHYHMLMWCLDVRSVLKEIGQLHGRTAFTWNKAENAKGRKVWCGTVERRIKSDRHFHAAINYVHNNPVKHGYAAKWQEWPFSSAASYLESVGREAAVQHWKDYDISDMGETWDP